MRGDQNGKATVHVSFFFISVFMFVLLCACVCVFCGKALVAKLKEARVDLEDDAIREGPVTEQFVECLINVFYDAWVQVNAQKRKLLIKASEEKQQKGAADGEQKGGAAAAGGAGGAAGGAGGAAAGGAKTPAASGAGGAVPPGAIVAGGPSGKIIIEPGTGRISSIDGEPLVLSSDDDKIYWNLHLRVRDLDLEAFVRFAKDSKSVEANVCGVPCAAGVAESLCTMPPPPLRVVSSSHVCLSLVFAV